MSRMTLLEVVQQVLDELDSDPANSIDDTVESQQVAGYAKSTYYEIVSERDWPFLRTKFSLTGLGDTARRTHMLLPEGFSKMDWVKYDKQEVAYLDPKEFQDMLDLRVELVDVVDADGFILNRNPLYYTSYDDEYVVFDAIDRAADDTLISSKSVCYGVVVPGWTHEDSFVPELPAKMFQTYVNEVIAKSFLNLKQQPNQRAERRGQRGRHKFQNESWRTEAAEHKYNSRVNYGRN